MNKIRFQVNENSDTEEPLTGFAEVADEEGLVDYFAPILMDFFMVYGLLSLTKDALEYVIKKSKGD